MAYSTPEKRRAYQNNYYKKSGAKKWLCVHTNYHLGKTWQETRDIWMEMFNSQRGLCAICGQGEATDVDHSHYMGKVRGLLYNKCNIMLHVFENREFEMRARLYLERFNG